MDIEERIRELAISANIRLDFPPVPADRCWVDGDVRCPYGTPEGQYILRPEGFCHDGEDGRGGCVHFKLHVVDQELTVQQETKAINDHFDAHRTDVTGELRALATEFSEGCSERLTLSLAADIIEAKQLDRDILLEDDLPE